MGQERFCNSKIPHQKSSMTLVQLLLACHSPPPVLLFVFFIVSCLWRPLLSHYTCQSGQLDLLPMMQRSLALRRCLRPCICCWCWDACLSVYPCHLSLVTLSFITEDICIYVISLTHLWRHTVQGLVCKMLLLTYPCSFTYSL